MRVTRLTRHGHKTLQAIFCQPSAPLQPREFIAMPHPRFILAILPLLAHLAAAQTLVPSESWSRHAIDDSSTGADGVKLGDANNDGLLDVVTGWEQGFVTRAYLHPGKDRVRAKWPSVEIGSTPSVEDATWVDLDGDSYLDVVSSCEGKEMAMHLHFAPKSGDTLDASQWTQAPLPGSKGVTRWMFAEAAELHFKGKARRLLFAASKDPNGTIGFWEIPRNPRSPTSKWRWTPLADAGWVMSIFPRDMDGDGDLDVFYIDRKGPFRGARWLENPGSPSGRWTNRLIGGSNMEQLFGKLADLDGDGLVDVLSTAKDRKVIWWRRLDASGLKWEKRVLEYPENTGRAKAVAAGDLDHDGLLDLVITCESAVPPLNGAFWIRQIKDKPFHSWEFRGMSGPDGVKYDRIELIDLDQDGDLDVLTCEEQHVVNGVTKGLGVFWYENPIADR